MVAKNTNGTKRNGSGQFVKGHAGGPGRPPRKVEDDYLAKFRKACTPAAFAKATKRLLKIATGDDDKAAVSAWKALAAYCLPSPERLLRLDLEDVPELRVAGQSPDEFTAETIRLLLVEAEARAGTRPPK